jgi:RHS repeat-associated protein
VTDPESKIFTHLRNVIGQETSLTDPSPGGITLYAYHPFGELKSITDAAGNVTSWDVNPRGFVIENSDPDSGVWAYEVNAFGETTKVRDAKTTAPAWTTYFTFDELSRMKTRDEAEGTTTLTWGKASHNTTTAKYIGRLKSVTSPGGYEEDYLFDEWSRLSRLRTTIDSTSWNMNYGYSAVTGLLETLQYPVSGGGYRLKIQYDYQNNLLKRVKEFGGATYWEGTSTDAWGHYQDELFGSGVIEITDFDQASGLMVARQAGVGGGTGLIDSGVDWADLRGNVTGRQDANLATPASEAFVNDSLGRFDSSTLNGGPNLDVTLDAIGNITAKGGQNYLYTGSQSGCSYYTHTQPRAVRKIGSTVYCYDANGNMVKRGGSGISYTSYNLPSVINSGSNSSTLSYGAFRNRYRQVAVTGAGTETTLYVAGLFERVTRTTGDVEYRHYIPGGNGLAAIHTRRTSGTNSTYYWHADHLGSPEVITDGSGGNPLRLSFGAYGERRDGSDWSGPPSAADLTAIGNITRRGFTGHEHLDSVGMIHMNGRVYDPAAGRFLSVDPIVDGVFTSQGINSYTYVYNNPLANVDPSGFDCEPSPGLTEEEAAAYISQCNAAFESAGWGPVDGTSGRWCSELGMGCRLTPTDPVNPGVEGSASGMGADSPISTHWQSALDAYNRMVSSAGGPGSLRSGTISIECGGQGQIACGEYEQPPLTWRTATMLYRQGNSPTVTVQARSIGLPPLISSDVFNSDDRTAILAPTSLPQYIVHGRVRVYRQGEYYFVYNELFDFDPKEVTWKNAFWAVPRNFGAFVGEGIAGPGVPFKIDYVGPAGRVFDASTLLPVYYVGD